MRNVAGQRLNEGDFPDLRGPARIIESKTGALLKARNLDAKIRSLPSFLFPTGGGFRKIPVHDQGKEIFLHGDSGHTAAPGHDHQTQQ
jgi:hypothetical protein